MSKIVVPIEYGQTNESIENGTHITSFQSWENLMPFLNLAIDKKPGEKITGFIVDEAGIKIRIKNED